VDHEPPDTIREIGIDLGWTPGDKARIFDQDVVLDEVLDYL